jgi:hypothetical protein
MNVRYMTAGPKIAEKNSSYTKPAAAGGNAKGALENAGPVNPINLEFQL